MKKESLQKIMFIALVIVGLFLIVNQFVIGSLDDSTGKSLGKKLSFSGKTGTTLGPGLTSEGKLGVREYPTISEVPKVKETGDQVQDALNKYVPTGTPWYGENVGVSFDDPLNSLNVWAEVGGPLGERSSGRFKGEKTIWAKDLTQEQKARYEKLISVATCDFCCGSPNRPTKVNECGCSHAAAARGIIKYFIQNYGDKYSDEQILGERSRWQTLWYPGPTVKLILSESPDGEASVSDLSKLPSMVGGC